MMSFFPKSLKWRLQLWHSLLLIGVLVSFGVAAWEKQKAQLHGDAFKLLAKNANMVLRTVGDNRPPIPREPGGPGGPREPGGPGGPREPGVPGEPGGPDRPPLQPRPPRPRLTLEEKAEVSGPDRYYLTWSRSGALLEQSEGAPARPLPRKPGGSPRPIERIQDGFFETIFFTPPGEVVLCGMSAQPAERALREYAWWLAGIGLGVLSLGLVGGWWVTSRAIRPIKKISEATKGISSGDLSTRIPVNEERSELGALALELNQTFAALERAFARQERFTADAAHELRTPITVVLSQTQLALSKERSPEEYRKALRACERAARRMHSLSESLLDLASLDAAALVLQKQSGDLANVARECADLIKPLAEQRQISLTLSLEHAPCQIDQERMAQVVTNLLANAVYFNVENGGVSVRTWQEGARVFLSVSDTGPGIKAAAIPKLFERFYRTDEARNRNQGGAGLGLAICLEIVSAHAGEISVTSDVGKGSCFTVSLPTGASLH